MDPMGRAIADYHKSNKASKLRVFSPMFEEDEIPLTTLFRNYESMPEIERKALDLAKGRVLDVQATRQNSGSWRSSPMRFIGYQLCFRR